MFMSKNENSFMERRIPAMPDEFLSELFKRWILGDWRISELNRDLVVKQIDLRAIKPEFVEPEAETQSESQAY